jgi:hypothetical protein
MKYLKMISAFAVAIGIACSAHGASAPLLDAKVARESTIERLLALLLPSNVSAKAQGEPRERPECYDKNGKAVYSYARCELLAREEANPACNGWPPGQCRFPKPCDARYCPGLEPGP